MARTQRDRRQRPGEEHQEQRAEQAAQTDAHTPSQMARPGSPLRAIGKPSNVVAIEEGEPGMPSRQQVMRPPVDPPT